MPEAPGGRPRHLPVMVAEVLELLAPEGDQLVVDCTVGLGGHAEAILRKEGFSGRVIGIDRDGAAIDAARARLADFGERFKPLHGRFGQLAELLEGIACGAADAVLFDLGVSSLQLEDPGRGFSFRLDGPLDMRMDPSCGQSAATLVSRLDAEALADVFREYGEERFSRRIAEALVRERESGPIATTGRLREIVHGATGGKRGRIDPATRVFQALRIAVNDELDEVERGLRAACTVLRPGGRVAAISFHSLEDRIVKRFLRDLALRHGARLLTRGGIRPSEAEVEGNPRARSAVLRAVRLGAAGGRAS